MQVFQRIANPYMYNGTPDKTNAPTPLLAPGEVGCAFKDQNTGQSCLRVYLDSGATSATPTGAVAQGQLAYWKDQSKFLVTNDSRFVDNTAPTVSNPLAYPNRVAGVFQLAVSTTPGINGTDGNPQLYVCDLTIERTAVQGGYMSMSGTPAPGQQIVATGTVSAPTGVGTAIGTAPVNQVLGTVASATAISGTLYPANINIGFVD